MNIFTSQFFTSLFSENFGVLFHFYRFFRLLTWISGHWPPSPFSAERETSWGFGNDHVESGHNPGSGTVQPWSMSWSKAFSWCWKCSMNSLVFHQFGWSNFISPEIWTSDQVFSLIESNSIKTNSRLLLSSINLLETRNENSGLITKYACFSWSLLRHNSGESDNAHSYLPVLGLGQLLKWRDKILALRIGGPSETGLTKIAKYKIWMNAKLIFSTTDSVFILFS